LGEQQHEKAGEKEGDGAEEANFFFLGHWSSSSSSSS